MNPDKFIVDLDDLVKLPPAKPVKKTKKKSNGK